MATPTVRKGQRDVKLSRKKIERDALDPDEGVQEEVRNSARALVEAVRRSRAGQFPRADLAIGDPRPK